MQKEFLFFTAGQFAKLHNLNRRTLHYYDEIGLFSPAHKGENNYRYYSYNQSAELENILALREIGMSIEEIKDYLKAPNSNAFLKIAAQKTAEISEHIRYLKKLKTHLQKKQEALALCARIYDGKIEVVQRLREFLLLTPLQDQKTESADMKQLMEHLQIAWTYSDYKLNCGSYISLDKIKRSQYESYDGLFTFVEHSQKGTNLFIKPEGNYLCGYCIGDWSKLPLLYQNMLKFAAQNGFHLTGNCYEKGLNEFAISQSTEYVTQIEIQLE